MKVATSSPLSDLSSIDSFHTANASSQYVSTSASSPLQDASPAPYRPAQELPLELKQHCQILLEEQLYTPAINVLNSVLCAAASRTRPTASPVAIPPPNHLALLSTLAIHPQHTNRADKPETLQVSSAALAYLRSLLDIVGPVNADFRSAFKFQTLPRLRRRAGHHSAGNNSDASDVDSDRDDDRLRGNLANTSGVWHMTSDFWSVVGWAFNCCTLYPQRWPYWRAWLEFMIEVLEADWTERERLDKVAGTNAAAGSQELCDLRSSSIMASYLDDHRSRQKMTSILKALEADGQNMASSSFREIFDKELKGPKKSSNKRKRETLDLANDRFADYFDEESVSSGASEPPTPHKGVAQRRSSASALRPGLAESIDLRLRLFKLTSAAIFTLRDPSASNDLYELFVERLKEQSLEWFTMIVTQRPNALLPISHATLIRELFHRLLPRSYKDPRFVDRENDEEGGLSAVMLEHCYVCHPANSLAPEDNAKLSIVVESALQLLWQEDLLSYSTGLAAAVEKGIAARDLKARKKSLKGRGKHGDAAALDTLTLSHERIRIMMEALKAIESGATSR